MIRKTLLALAATLALGGVMPASGFAGNWEYWGWRTNSNETYALATQSPSSYRSFIPGFGAAVNIMGWSWHWNAQGARRIGQCTGITWSASPIYVGCARR